jgi:hypothetical protein
VASALLGMGVVAALTALDTAQIGARQAVDQAWVNCVARGKAEAILAGPYDQHGNYDGGRGGRTDVTGLQRVTVTVTKGQARTTLAFYKSQALSGPDVKAAPGSCGL